MDNHVCIHTKQLQLLLLHVMINVHISSTTNLSLPRVYTERESERVSEWVTERDYQCGTWFVFILYTQSILIYTQSILDKKFNGKESSLSGFIQCPGVSNLYPLEAPCSAPWQYHIDGRFFCPFNPLIIFQCWTLMNAISYHASLPSLEPRSEKGEGKRAPGTHCMRMRNLIDLLQYSSVKVHFMLMSVLYLRTRKYVLQCRPVARRSGELDRWRMPTVSFSTPLCIFKPEQTHAIKSVQRYVCVVAYQIW
jgi:hypothetical protein